MIFFIKLRRFNLKYTVRNSTINHSRDRPLGCYHSQPKFLSQHTSMASSLIKYFFYKMFLTFTNMSKTGFENRKFNYSNGWNYFYCLLTSYFFFLILNHFEVQILEVTGALTHDLFMTISFSSRGRSSRTAPNCLTEILGCLRTTVTKWTDYACSHPSTNTAKCCLTSEILRV